MPAGSAPRWAAPPPRPDGAVRLASVNLWGLFADWPGRLARLVEGWPEVDADIVALQEVRVEGAVDQAQDLQQLLGYRYAGRDVRVASRADHEGVALLSRLPLRAVESIRLPLPAPEGMRLALRAEVELGSGWVPVWTAHTTVAPAEVLLDQLKVLFAAPDDPMLLVGDLNAEPSVVRPLAEPVALSDVLGYAEVPTWPVDADRFRAAWTAMTGAPPFFRVAPRRLDYVLTRGVPAMAAGVTVLGDSERGYASDHAVVWADIATGIPD